MITQQISQAKLEKSESQVSGRTGLAMVYSVAKHFKTDKIIDDNFSEPNSNAGYTASEKIISFALTLINGGNKIEDIEILRADNAFLNQCGLKRLSAADTIRNFLLDTKNKKKLEKVLEDLAVKAMGKSSLKEFTFDIDWTLIESGKNSADWSYKGEKGYGVLLGFIYELGICITVDYRPGNIPPCVGIAKQIKKAAELAKRAGKKIKGVRSDSAGHSKEVFNLCLKKEIDFYISVDQNSLVKEAIEAISDKSWQELESQPGKQWTETLYPMPGLKPDRALRILVIRWKNPTPTLFDQTSYCYHAITTSNNEIEAMNWLEFHNGRMGSENFNKEIKSGFGLDWCPSQDIIMNRNYFLAGLFAYNLFQIMKCFYLEGEAASWTLRTFQFKFISVCGKLVTHAKQLFYKIMNVTDEIFLIFKKVHQILCST